METDKVITVQSDKTVLVDVHHPQFEEVRRRIISFAELVKTPEHVHFYRITPISLWNSAANGVPLDTIFEFLNRYKKYDIPQNVIDYIRRHYSNYGKVVFESAENERIVVRVNDHGLFEKLCAFLEKYALSVTPDSITVEKKYRGVIKSELIKHLIPVRDVAGYDRGNRMPFDVRRATCEGKDFRLRYYQSEAVYNFSQWKEGSGVVVLPCGSGKTMVGIGVMKDIEANTLIITTSVEAIRQWKREILDKTTLAEDEVGEYTSQKKDLKPVTITTYHMLIHKTGKTEGVRNIELFTEVNWGLIIYDEVHILPAPIFRMTTFIQSKRRLGLTATLVREDNLETEVFTLIGPKVYEYSWKALEKEGFISEAICNEIRVPLTEDENYLYLNSGQRIKFRIASENSSKIGIVENLLAKYRENHVIIIGHFITQLEEISSLFGIPLITGETPNADREVLYQKFRGGEIKVLAVSRVGNFSIDLPLADVAIQVSGIFGSRQEEAQRLGRILRPNNGKSYFYTLVTRDTIEEEFARKRQMFLLEQGYRYTVIEAGRPTQKSESGHEIPVAV
jgi:DNA excision repair protein ERCC-3